MSEISLVASVGNFQARPNLEASELGETGIWCRQRLSSLVCVRAVPRAPPAAPLHVWCLAGPQTFVRICRPLLLAPGSVGGAILCPRAKWGLLAASAVKFWYGLQSFGLEPVTREYCALS